MVNFQPDVSVQQKTSPDSIFYQFSPEETKVIKECNRESFYQRSLPFSLILGVGSYMGVNAGFLKSNVKWGPWPKVIFGGIIGYFVGKYSYQAICAEKLMQIPNSEIGRVLRERKGKLKGDLFERNVMSPTIIPGTSSNDSSSFTTDYKSNIDIDVHKSMNLLDTDYRPDYDGLLTNKTNEIPLSNINTPTSYDELRVRNRQEYERIQPNKPVYRSPSSPNTQPIWDNQSYPSSDQIKNSSQLKESHNQYGDVFN